MEFRVPSPRRNQTREFVVYSFFFLLFIRIPVSSYKNRKVLIFLIPILKITQFLSYLFCSISFQTAHVFFFPKRRVYNFPASVRYYWRRIEYGCSKSNILLTPALQLGLFHRSLNCIHIDCALDLIRRSDLNSDSFCPCYRKSPKNKNNIPNLGASPTKYKLEFWLEIMDLFRYLNTCIKMLVLYFKYFSTNVFWTNKIYFFFFLVIYSIILSTFFVLSLCFNDQYFELLCSTILNNFQDNTCRLFRNNLLKFHASWFKTKYYTK